ncbi:hypothetical protein [Shewanella algae]|uniref:hypothetical protein n=1 Tax=Shewanella algae TaxID=38313 RepID=UPI0031F54D60
MSWELSQEIMDAVPNWQRRNQIHALARHLLSLESPPTDEQACYDWLEQQVSQAYQYGFTELGHLRLVAEALFLAQVSLDDPEVSAIVTKTGLPSGRAAILLQWAKEQQSSTMESGYEL